MVRVGDRNFGFYDTAAIVGGGVVNDQRGAFGTGVEGRGDDARSGVHHVGELGLGNQFVIP